MKYDLKKHELLGILVGNTLKFDSDELPDNEPMGVSFDEIKKKMKCDMIELNLIASELYVNKEIEFYDNEIKGMCCIHNGKVSFSTNKYKNRYYDRVRDYVKFIFQLLIPALSLIVAIIALKYSAQNKETTQQIQELKEKTDIMQSELSSHAKEIQSIRETIFLNDSLINN